MHRQTDTRSNEFISVLSCCFHFLWVIHSTHITIEIPKIVFNSSERIRCCFFCSFHFISPPHRSLIWRSFFMHFILQPLSHYICQMYDRDHANDDLIHVSFILFFFILPHFIFFRSSVVFLYKMKMNFVLVPCTHLSIVSARLLLLFYRHVFIFFHSLCVVRLISLFAFSCPFVHFSPSNMFSLVWLTLAFTYCFNVSFIIVIIIASCRLFYFHLCCSVDAVFSLSLSLLAAWLLLSSVFFVYKDIEVSEI